MQTVDKVMTRDVITVTPETPIMEVARLLVDHGISGVPVTDPGGRVVGVVSEGDVLIKEAGHPTPSRRPLARLFGLGRESREQQAKVDAQTAGDAMTTPVLTIGAGTTIQAAAELMTARRVNRLPVVDGEGHLQGIVTRADLVRAFVRSDEELESEIRTEVLLHVLWLDPEKFQVSVHDGVVRVHGAVARRSTVDMIGRLVRMVPGVVAVDVDVTWETDDQLIEAPGPDLLSPYDI